MAIDSIERIRYYERQFLGALDFDAQQAYHRDMRRRHNLAPHTWGIHVGLELHQTPKEGVPDEVEVCILPGAACDGFGREVVVLQPFKLERAPFLNFGGGSMPVWIAYDQEEIRPPRSGYELCDVEGQFARVRETFRVVVGPMDPFHDKVRVAGKDAKIHGDAVNAPDPNDPCPVIIPSDESAPYQEFPNDSDDPRWLIRLGSVEWDGAKLVAANAELLTQGRRYSSLVGSSLLAQESALLIRSRRVPELKADPGVTVTLEGSLHIKRDLQMHGGVVQFREPDGKDTIPVFTLERKNNLAGGGKDLCVRISEAGPSNHRFSVGPQIGAAYSPKFWVNDLGNARFEGSLEVAGKITTDNSNGDRIIFWKTPGAPVPLAIGTEEDGIALYATSTSRHRWYVGVPVDEGVSDVMELDAARLRLEGGLSIKGVIDFDDALGDRLMLWGPAGNPNAYGFGIESGTLYARANSQHRWYLGINADGGASDTMELNITRLRVNTGVEIDGVLDFDDKIGDRLMLWGAANGAGSYGLGIESGTLYARANLQHRWYVGRVRDDGGTDTMELDANGLTVNGRVNGRDMVADGIKLDGVREVRVSMGWVNHGGFIYPPTGFSVSDCEVLLSPSSFRAPDFDLNEFGVSARFQIECYAAVDGNRWRAEVGWYQAGHGGVTGWVRSIMISARYLVVGMK